MGEIARSRKHRDVVRLLKAAEEEELDSILKSLGEPTEGKKEKTKKKNKKKKKEKVKVSGGKKKEDVCSTEKEVTVEAEDDGKERISVKKDPCMTRSQISHSYESG